MGLFIDTLGIGDYAPIFDTWCEKFPQFKEAAKSGFCEYGEDREEFIMKLRWCIIEVARWELSVYHDSLKYRLTAMKPDTDYREPWRVYGLTERSNEVIHQYLLSGCDAKKAAEEIVKHSKTTHWRK